MNALIYFELISEPFDYKFDKPFLKWVQQNYPELNILDLDQYSDQAIFNYAEKIFDEAEKVIIVIDGKPDIKVEKLTGLNEVSLKNRDKVFCLLRFRSSFLERMFGILGNQNFLMTEKIEDQKMFIKDAAQAQL